MERLALTLSASRYEAPTSYLSRLAARNYCDDITTFCKDVGVDLGADSSGDTDAVKYVCHLAGLPDGAFRNTTIIKTTTMRYWLGAEAMDTHTLNRGEVRVCPVCVREQFTVSDDPWSVIHRLHWQIPQIQRCTQHGESLIILGEKNNSAARYDITLAIQTHRHLLYDANDPGVANDFDIYLTDRIYGLTTGEWCDRLTIPALWRCSEALGITLDYGKTKFRRNLAKIELQKAALRGFKLLRSGEGATVLELEKFTAREVRKRGYQPAPQYGELQRLLRSKKNYHDELEPMRELMRKYVIGRYPLRTGYLVFGKPLAKRRLHSMLFACKDAKIRRELVEDMLAERNVGVRGKDGLFALTQPLTVEIVKDLKAEKHRFLCNNEATKFLGATETMFKELHKSGVLQPLTGKNKWERKSFDAEFLTEFLMHIFQSTKVFRKATKGTETLLRATRVAKCNVPDILILILGGKLKPAGRLGDKYELKNLLIHEDDLKLAFPAKVPNGYTYTETCQRLFITNATLHRLRDEGLLVSRRMKSSISRMTNHLVLPESVAQFEKEFFSLGMLQCSTPAFANLRAVDLDRLRLKPIFDDVGLRRIYRWRDLPDDPIAALEALKAVEPVWDGPLLQLPALVRRS